MIVSRMKVGRKYSFSGVIVPMLIVCVCCLSLLVCLQCTRLVYVIREWASVLLDLIDSSRMCLIGVRIVLLSSLVNALVRAVFTVRCFVYSFSILVTGLLKVLVIIVTVAYKGVLVNRYEVR